MKASVFCFMVISVLLFSGCQQATSGSTQPAISGPVQGNVNGQPFATVLAVAKASKTASGSYEIALTGSASTPNVFFTVGSSPQAYRVKTLGMNGLAVTAYMGGMDFISFDGGTVTITKVDTNAKEISGTFDAVNTTDGNSSLTGVFSAPIQPIQ